MEVDEQLSNVFHRPITVAFAILKHLWLLLEHSKRIQRWREECKFATYWNQKK